jgi:hypothetical protein
MITDFPEQSVMIFEKFLSNPNMFSHIIKGESMLERFTMQFPEYKMFFDLNFKLLLPWKGNEWNPEVLSEIQNLIKDGIINRTVRYKSLQLCFAFADGLFGSFIPPLNRDELQKMNMRYPHSRTYLYYEKFIELYDYLLTARVPSLAESCVNSLKQNGIFAKTSEHSLQIHMVRSSELLEPQVTKLLETKEKEILKNHTIFLIQVLKTKEWYVMGMNHEGKITTDGPIHCNSELGNELVNTTVPISAEKRQLLLTAASKYLGTNYEDLNIKPEIKKMCEEEIFKNGYF